MSRSSLLIVPVVVSLCFVGGCGASELEYFEEGEHPWRTGLVQIDDSVHELEYQIIDGERVLDGDIILPESMILSAPSTGGGRRAPTAPRSRRSSS